MDSPERMEGGPPNLSTTTAIRSHRVVMTAKEMRGFFRFARVHHAVPIVSVNDGSAVAVKCTHQGLEPLRSEVHAGDTALGSYP